MKFTAACTLALVASASAFAPAPTASVSEIVELPLFRIFCFDEIKIFDPAFLMMSGRWTVEVTNMICMYRILLSSLASL
jgi:hypothetical protein